MKAYAVMLIGQGDTDIKIIDRETFDWINDDRQTGRVNGESGWADKTCPDAVRSRIEDLDEEQPYPYVTIGSLYNDRAISAPPLKIGDTELSYWDMSSFMDAVKKYNIQIIESFEGYLY